MSYSNCGCGGLGCSTCRPCPTQEVAKTISARPEQIYRNKRYREDPEYRARILENGRKSREKNKEKIRQKKRDAYRRDKEKYDAYYKKYRANNQDKIKARREAYKERGREVKKLYDKRNKERNNAYTRKHFQTNRNFMVKCILMSRMRTALRKRGANKSEKTENLLGCTIPEFMEYIQSMFKPGMHWNNRREWHVDHILPCASFDLTDPEEQRKCFHYTNLQPLWAKENMMKSDKFPHQLKVK